MQNSKFQEPDVTLGERKNDEFLVSRRVSVWFSLSFRRLFQYGGCMDYIRDFSLVTNFPMAMKQSAFPSILTWLRGILDHEGGSSRSRPFHCTPVGLKPAIAPNVGNSGAQFLVVGICVRANPFIIIIIILYITILHLPYCIHYIH